MLKVGREKYNSLYGVLKDWRDQTHGFENKETKGILPFVSGLRFSANIIRILNLVFEGSQLRAVWGHIVNENEEYNIYSRECDIIIFRNIPGGIKGKWNGDKEHKIMDFYFIGKAASVGVVSCKSKYNSLDKLYPKQLTGFTKNVWLFAECCGHNKEEAIKKLVKKSGYKDFWSLYSWDEKKGSIPNEKTWKRFEDTMIKLARKHPLG